jgi:hypothetical protein
MYSRFSYNAIAAFLENTVLWKNRFIETIGTPPRCEKSPNRHGGVPPDTNFFDDHFVFFVYEFEQILL